MLSSAALCDLPNAGGAPASGTLSAVERIWVLGLGFVSHKKYSFSLCFSVFYPGAALGALRLWCKALVFSVFVSRFLKEVSFWNPSATF